MNKAKHIGIILDGNRRFSKKIMKAPWKGHEYGAKKLKNLVEWCKELDIKELTLYAFSMQNFNRPKEEFDHLMRIFKENFEKLKDDKKIDEYGIKIRVIGRIHLFPKDVYEAMKHIMEKTKNNSNYIINFAMAYGGQEEIIDAIKKIGRKIDSGELKTEDINKEIVNKNLYMSDQPDFIIRTGGDHRTSNFLIWQSWYSEWFFLEKTWPEFEKGDLVECLECFNNRERRFGR